MKTKKTLAWLVQFLALCLILSFNAFAEELKSADTVHAPITQQLVTMVEHNPENELPRRKQRGINNL